MPKHPAEWFNDTDFWEQFAPIMFDEAHWAEVPAVAGGIVKLALQDYLAESKDEPRPKVLDLCCGFGRIATELARWDLDVTGVDITESYLQTAREEAAYENLKIEYINADARTFIRPGFFNAAVNLYTSFGYFENQEEDQKLIKNVCESLAPGGTFIIETLGKEIAVLNFVETEWFERAGFKVLTQYEIQDSWSILKNRWILVKDGKTIEKVFTQRLYSAAELRTMMLQAGFSTVEIYGSWDETPYDQYAERLIVVGRKK